MEPTTIAVDLAKRVFQIHFVDPATGAIHSKVPSSCRSSLLVYWRGLATT